MKFEEVRVNFGAAIVILGAVMVIPAGPSWIIVGGVPATKSVIPAGPMVMEAPWE